jgi:ribosome-binding protein aMBF1 (putative translation factor)
MISNQKKFNKRLGSLIRACRERKGLTITVLAQKSFVNEKYIGKIERGECSPSIYLVNKIAMGLKIKLSQLTNLI